MIALQDCVVCPTESEVLAIAEHQHVPEIPAGALAECLLKHRPGANKIHCDSRAAFRRHASELANLIHFLESHSEHTN